MLYKRVITASIGAFMLFLIVQFTSPLAFFILVMMSISVGLYEFYRMFNNSGYHPQTKTGIFVGLLVALGFYMGTESSWIYSKVFEPSVMVAFAFVVALVFRLFSGRDMNGAAVDVSLTFTGIVYVAWLSSYFILLRCWDRAGIDGRDLLFFLFLVTWATDTGAYFVGTRFGKHKLYSQVSPKKSVEGAIGGFVFSTGFAVICKYWFYNDLDLFDAVALGGILGIVGQVGDLAESMIKRSVRVKDSGGILPGHGGYLDRMDSMLLNAPALYYYTLVMVATAKKGGM